MSEPVFGEDWTDDELFQWWEERAAIMEFDGELPRDQAQYLAYREMKKHIGTRKVATRIFEEARRFKQ